MPTVDFDRQAIERRDFPIGRRGYDPAAVDAHLRALAAEFDELQRTAATGSVDISVASTAGHQVQGILEAAEAAAGEIERGAQESARQVREASDRDAERTRQEAIEKARTQVAAVAQVCSNLLQRVGSMDAEVNALVGSLRAGAGRLAADLAAVETGMGELYGAASGRQGQSEQISALESQLSMPAPPPAPAPEAPAAAVAAQPAQAAESAAGGDVDGARLIALNMALNGESRTDTERYLAENFEIPDRLKLIDEVYAAVEG
jgi:DivIVA domain-containing protein